MTIQVALIQMSLISLIQMSLILVPIAQCFTFWKLLRVFFLYCVLKFHHNVTGYGSLFIHPAWHLMGLLNLMSFFSSGKCSFIIALSIPSYLFFLSLLFHLALRVDECCNFQIYILYLPSFLPCCSPALHSETHISFIEGELVTRSRQSKEGVWGIVKFLFLDLGHLFNLWKILEALYFWYMCLFQ